MGDRVWVDLEQCKKLVDNICVTFQTKLSPSSGAGPGGGESGGSSGKPSAGGGGEAAVASASGGGGEKADSEALQTLIDEVDIEPRYLGHRYQDHFHFLPLSLSSHPVSLCPPASL